MMGRKTKGSGVVIIFVVLVIFSPAWSALKFNAVFSEWESGFMPVVLAGDRFTDNGDGTVTDHLLGVMWAATDNQGNVNWMEAQQYCRVGPPQVLGRYDNWRMPEVEELESLFQVDHHGYESSCGKTVKVAAPIKLSCAWVWTSLVRNITAVAFNFQRGYRYADRKVQYRHYRALPVRDLSSGQ